MAVEIKPLIPDAQPPGVRTVGDVLAQMALEVREPTDAPVRDALIDLILGVLLEFQYRADLAEAENDVLRSTGENLRDDGAERGFSQGEGESEAEFRQRILTTTAVVTKDAIVAAVNALLAPFTSTECILLEASLDGWFINDGTDGNGNPARWHSFVGATPNYPDRYFQGDEAQNEGIYRPNSDPQTARVFNGTPRQFLLLVPDLTGFSDDAAWVWDGSDTTQIMQGVGWFVDDGTDADIGGYVYLGALSETVLYDTLVRTVNLLAGQSISWLMHATLEAE